MPIVYGVLELNETLDVVVTAAAMYDPLVSASHTATKQISFYTVENNERQWKSLGAIQSEMGIGPISTADSQDIKLTADQSTTTTLTNFLLDDITQGLYSKQSWADAEDSVADHLSTLHGKNVLFTTEMYNKLKNGFVVDDLEPGDGFGYIATRTITSASLDESPAPSARELAVMFIQQS